VAGGIGSAPGLLVGAAIGAAAGAALEPAFEVPRQDAWNNNRNRILDVGLVAQLVAQGGIDLSDAHAEAHREGYTDDKLDALVYLEQTVPGVGEALRLWRLGLLSDALFSHVLVKAGLDQRYAAPILNSKLAEVVGLGDIAYGVVRGILPAPAWVPVAPPAKGDKVPRFPQVQIDPLELAQKLGFDEDMLKLEVGRSGLSMAPGMAAQAFFRNIIGPNDFLLAIAEGDLRTEWADAVREVSRQILTAGEYAELELRGFIDAPTRRNLTAQHGMSDTDSDRLHNVLGRAPGVHAITTGLARGGAYPGSYANVPEPYRSAIQRSNIREEFAEIEYADRFSYPPAFVLRALTQAGELGDEAAVQQVLEEIGWKPSFAKSVAAAWTAGQAAGEDPHVKKAQTTLFTEAHKAYVKDGLAQDQVTPALGALAVPPSAQQQIFALWDAEKQLAAAVPPAA
jgi:hypothetical protein